MKRLFLVLGLLSVLLSACAKQKEEQPAAADSTAADSVTSDSARLQKSETLGVSAPAWYAALPHEAGVLYAAAHGRSLRASIARDKAVMRAQRQLAEKLEMLTQNDTTESTAHGGAKAEEEPLQETQLIKAKIIKQKQVKKGKFWYVFVLMELPLSEQ